MIAVSRALRRLLKISAVAAVLLFATAATLALAGAPTAAVAAVASGVVAGIPAALSAAAKPRPGLVWQGRYAEPWRQGPSPGDPSHAVNAEADGEASDTTSSPRQ